MSKILPISIVATDKASGQFKRTAEEIRNLEVALKQTRQEFRRGEISAEQFEQGQREIVAEMRLVKQQTTLNTSQMQVYNRTMRQTGNVGLEARRGISSIRGAMGTLAATSLGAQGRLGEVAGIIGTFAIGNVWTLGILSGLAAIALAYKEITKEAKAAAEAADKAVEALNKTAETEIFKLIQQRSTIRGGLEQLEADQARLRAAQASGRSDIRTVGAIGRSLGMSARFQAAVGRDIPGLVDAALVQLSTRINEHRQALGLAFDKEVELREEQNRDNEEARRTRTMDFLQRRQEERDLQNQANLARTKEIADRVAADRAAREAIYAEQRRAAIEAAKVAEAMRRAAEEASAALELRISGGSDLMVGLARLRAAARRRQIASAPDPLLGGGATDLERRIPGFTEGAGKIHVFENLEMTGRNLERAATGIGDELYGAAEGVKYNGRQLVGAMAIAANSLAGMITGQSSFLGGMGGITSGLSLVPQLASFATPLGIAGIGFSFLDALTSDRNQDSMTAAHLAALKAHDQERPPANIYIDIDPFDPNNRNHQRIIDDARREAEAAGYAVNVRQG